MRTKPYTFKGIRRMKCIRCGEQARFQWEFCADGNIFRPLCTRCDTELNELVLKFLGFPDWEDKIKTYKERVGNV